jgi:hypothetical protein
VKEVSIDEMSEVHGRCRQEDEMAKLKFDGLPGPDLRQQLEAMAYVDPDEDPALDPQSEYNRLIEKYGADEDLPMPVVAREYGEYRIGRVRPRSSRTSRKETHAQTHTPEGIRRGPRQAAEQMNVAEMREALTARGIRLRRPPRGRRQLREKLEGALVD